MAPTKIREVEEETGLKVQLTRLLGSSQWEMGERQIAYLYFGARVIGGELRLSDEHDAIEWVPCVKLADMNVAPPYREFLQSFIKTIPARNRTEHSTATGTEHRSRVTASFSHLTKRWPAV